MQIAKETLGLVKTVSIIIVAALVIVYLVNMIREQKDVIKKYENDNTVLKQKLKTSLEMKEGKIVYKWRDKEGNTNTREGYVPPEGGVRVDEYKDGEKPKGNNLTTTTIPISSNTYVVIKKAGFCFKLQLSGIYDFENPYLGLDARLFFINRVGLGLGMCKASPYGFIDRRVDDVLKFAKNTLVGVVFWKDFYGMKLSVQF